MQKGVLFRLKKKSFSPLKVKFKQKRLNNRIPYRTKLSRTKLSRTKVTTFWLGDENVCPNVIQKVNIDKSDENLA